MNRESESEVKRRSDGSNIIPGKVLFSSIYISILGLWLSWKFLSDEKAVFVFGKHTRTYIEVSGSYSSFLGSLSMLMMAIAGASVIADHFDRRENEHKYKKFLKLSGVGILIFLGLSIFIGWKFEHIQIVPN